MRLRGLIAVAVACACTYACARKPPPQPQPVLRNARAELPPVPPSVSTCDDVGVAINAMDERFDADDVARECKFAEWPASLRNCVTTHKDFDCLRTLGSKQRFDWLGLVESAATAGQPASCDQINGFEHMPPLVARDAPQPEWLFTARIHVVLRACKAGWPPELRDCLADSDDALRVLACLDVNLDGDQRAALEKSLAALPKLAAKIEKLRKTPDAYECDDVVDTRYADATWKGKLADVPATERAKKITASRERMREVCVDTHWEDSTRACIVATGDVFPCFDDQYIQLWDYPAAFIRY